MAPLKEMKKLTRTQILSLVSLGAIGVSAPSAYADFYLHPWDDHHAFAQHWDLSADFLYFRSTSNFDSAGTAFTPNDLDSYQRYLLDLNASYGLTPKLTAYARLEWAVAKSDSFNTNYFSGSVYGLGDQTLGLNYRAFERPQSVAIDLQAQIDFAGYSNNTGAAPASGTLGDASTDVSVGAFASLPVLDRPESYVRLVGGAGYTYRTQSYSAAIPWSVDAQLHPRKEGLIVNAGFFGISSLKNDTRAGDASFIDTSAGSPGSGGSYFTNAINPSLVSARAEIGWRTEDRLEFTGAFADTIWGKEAPNGYTFSGSLKFHFNAGGHGREAHDPIYEGTTQYGRSNKGYVNYDLEGKVLRSNDRFQLVKIDIGIDAGVQIGDVFDIFSTNPDGSRGPAVARGRVTDVKGKEAAIKVEEYYKEVWIDEGFAARRVIR